MISGKNKLFVVSRVVNLGSILLLCWQNMSKDPNGIHLCLVYCSCALGLPVGVLSCQELFCVRKWCDKLGQRWEIRVMLRMAGSRILVRGGQPSFDPKGGALSPKFAQNRGFSLTIAWKRHDFEKILGARGDWAPGPPGSASVTYGGTWLCGGECADNGLFLGKDPWSLLVVYIPGGFRLIRTQINRNHG